MRLMLCRGVISSFTLAITLALASSSLAQISYSALVRPQGASTFKGRGMLVHSATGCMIITAAHVLEGAQDAEWFAPRLTIAGQSGRVTVAVAYSDGGNENDFALLELGADAGPCAPLPTDRTLQSSIVLGANADIVLGLPDGSSQLVSGKIVKVATQRFAVSVLPGAQSKVAPGSSGSPVTIGGAPAGILLGRESNGDLAIQRLDYIVPLAERSM